MATSILRLGRLGSLKCFQSQSWMVWRNRSAASFCTQAEDPPKRPKKTQPASKTVAPDERASLLAYRTAVIFPVKVAETPVFPVKSAGVTAAGSGAAASAELQVDPPSAEFTSSKPADEAAEGSSSDSSSSSSSDSDSDSDDELSQAKTQISEPTVKHESGDRKVTSKLKDDAEKSQPKYDRGSARETNKFVVPTAEICSEGSQGAAAGAVSGAPAEAEEPGHSPESTEVTASPAGPDVSAENVSTASRPADDSADVPAGTKGSTSAGSPKALAVEHGEAADGAGAEAAEVLEGSSSPADAAVKPPEAVKAEASSSTESSEELMDAAPVRAESVVEELQPEETAAAAAAPPEPEEPLDISTYKNYQHHSYHPFTFADMDVEMAKYRLPQPTANRH